VTTIKGKLMKLFFVVILLVGLFGCAAITNPDQRLFIDVKLIGVWEGEYIEKTGTIRKWMQVRKADGSYKIDFSFQEVDGTVNQFSESGKWWIKDGLFHELAPSWMKESDIYQYHFKQKDCVSFVLVSGNESTEEIDDYEFTECLSKDAPLVKVLIEVAS
jgi:hypothetical protein